MFPAEWFDEDGASAELKAIVAQIEALKLPGLDHPLSPEEARAIRQAEAEGGAFGPPPPPSERVEVHRVPGPAGEFELRCHRPQGHPDPPRATLLHIHGGGWFAGSAAALDTPLEQRADRLNVAIASVEYHLAPEHPYPAAPDDCEAAALWLDRHAREELGADLALIGGESGGAHLSAVTLLRLRDRHGLRLAGAYLPYGTYDLSGVPSHGAFDGRSLLLDGPSIRAAVRTFVPDENLWRDPDVSPLWADLAGLCPALFLVGTLDPVLDQTLFFYARWVAAGNPAEIEVFPGAPHGFDGFPAPEGERARRLVEDFLLRCLEDQRE